MIICSSGQKTYKDSKSLQKGVSILTLVNHGDAEASMN